MDLDLKLKALMKFGAVSMWYDNGYCVTVGSGTFIFQSLSLLSAVNSALESWERYARVKEGTF
jgi:hypothetical protein